VTGDTNDGLDVAVIGVGLIGGSLARAVKSSGFARSVTGCALHASELERARELRVIDRGDLDPEVVAANADIVVVATDLKAMADVFAKLAGTIGPETIVTDVGSVKGRVVAEARAAFGDRFPRFVPGHPIAGTEKSGVEASLATLYERHLVLLTPAAETDPAAVATVTRMWASTGARVETLDADEHDHALALTSHVPHVVAYAMVEGLRRAAAASREGPGLLRFAAGGFADITRIARSRPDLWADIVARNRRAVLDHGRMLERILGEFLDALEAEDAERLEAAFAAAAETRHQLKDPRGADH